MVSFNDYAVRGMNYVRIRNRVEFDYFCKELLKRGVDKVGDVSLSDMVEHPYNYVYTGDYSFAFSRFVGEVKLKFMPFFLCEGHSYKMINELDWNN